MPEVLIGLLAEFWRFVPALTMFGLAGSYSAWAGTGSSQGTPGGVISTLWHVITGQVPNVLKAFGMNIHTAHKATRSAVSHWALANERLTTAWFTHLNLLVRRTYASNLANVGVAADAIERLATNTKTATTYKNGVTVKTRANTALKTAHTAITREHALSSTFTKTHREQVRLNVHYTTAIDSTLPWALPRTRTRVGTLERDQAKLRERTTSLEDGALKTFRWLRTHPYAAATGVFAGAVAIALQRLGWGVFRCRAWQSLGRRLTCGMGKLLEDLLLGVVDVLIITDLCRITQLMISTAESSIVQTALGDLVNGIDSLIRCQGVSRPVDLQGYTTASPPLQVYAATP